MADDPSAALEEIRADLNVAVLGLGLDAPGHVKADLAGYLPAVTAWNARLLLAAVDAALEHHQPVQLYGTVEDYRGKTTCGHDADYDGDAHFEGDDGIWYCKGKPTVTVCSTCCDPDDADLRAQWPCPTYAGIARALTGKEAGVG